ncbi:MAG TPA: prepilin-type N-terminal cleavage/methylation domain-containing protein [Candidatus Polarisedimenticolia bacterium]|nr:prepilin-type N-terminal cleavage/methylation domain-containing protein [Candidatus Polarisedimenticolia bacterium]
MLRNRGFNLKDNRGFSLIEMLVASAIFAIAATVAFILYSAAQKSYKSGENFTDQQQSTRVAFDRMISDLRLAGFNYNPDGDSTRVDEQVEGAWETAVTIRGDFDFEDPSQNTTPESTLAGGSYNVVSVGNDEIVTYVLAKPGTSGPTGPATITLNLDPDRPRAKSNKTVIIPNVVLVQNNPPYTLYRVTLADVNGVYPVSPQAASNFVYEPVADNIKSMVFQYWDDAGNALGPNPGTPTDPSDDLGGADANILPRSRIRRITVNLVGMTPDEDLDYTDVTDASATTHYRKFDLNSDVNPENLGKSGVKDIDITPPPAPTNISLVHGHCKGILVKWDTPSVTSGITAYSVKFWPQATPSAFQTQGFTYPHLEFGVQDLLGHAFVSLPSQGVTYCFQVKAKDAVGNQSGWTPTTSPPCLDTTEASTPGAPQNLVASGNGTITEMDRLIHLTWSEVKSNGPTQGVVTGDPNLIGAYTVLRDGNGYKLYRSLTNGFTPAVGDLIGSPGNGVLQYDDTTMANCVNYYYKLTTVDTCGTESPYSSQALGRSTTTIKPAPPSGVSGSRTDHDHAQISWPAVTTNALGQTLSILEYRIYRVTATSGQSGSVTFTGSPRGTITDGSTTWTDDLDNPADSSALANGQSLYYIVKAADACGLVSDPSNVVEVNCTTKGDRTVTPADGTTKGPGATDFILNLTNTGSDKYSRVRVGLADSTVPGTELWYSQVTAVAGSWLTFPQTIGNWTVPSADKTYNVNWQIETTEGCIFSWTTSLRIVTTLSCQLTLTNAVFVTSGGDRNVRWNWNINNASGKNLKLTGIDISWGPTTTQKLTEIDWAGVSAPPSTPSLASPGASTMVQARYNVALSRPDLPGISCGTCTKSVSLFWGASMVGNTLTLRYYFIDPATTLTGTCDFNVP